MLVRFLDLLFYATFLHVARMDAKHGTTVVDAIIVYVFVLVVHFMLILAIIDLVVPELDPMTGDNRSKLLFVGSIILPAVALALLQLLPGHRYKKIITNFQPDTRNVRRTLRKFRLYLVLLLIGWFCALVAAKNL